MGLEAANFLFSTERNIQELLSGIENIYQNTDKYYVYKEDEKYWIDLELIDNHELSIRITLCNPFKEVTEAFITLCTILLKGKGVLYNYNYKTSIKQMNEATEKKIRLIFLERKKLFNSIYGEIVKVAGSEEFSMNYITLKI